MPRSARSGDRPQDPEHISQPPHVEDDRLKKRVEIKDTSDIPVRTIIYMEVGDAKPQEVQAAVIQVSSIYAAGAHPTYVLPVRNGKLTTDIVFEEGILEMVRSLCVVEDGQINLKSGWRKVDVMRTSA